VSDETRDGDPATVRNAKVDFGKSEFGFRSKREASRRQVCDYSWGSDTLTGSASQTPSASSVPVTVAPESDSDRCASGDRLVIPLYLKQLHELPSKSSDWTARQPHARGWLG
jgi:hypothetical protein